MMDFADIEDIALRLLVAVLAGAALGFNRELRGKSIGVRTLAIVSLGSALSVMAVGSAENIDAASRVIQGLLTGIGFLGAGVIVHHEHGRHVHGLTSAACVWLTACIGIVCGAGEWKIVVVAGAMAAVVLLLGRTVERFFHRISGARRDSVSEPPRENGPPAQSDSGPHQPGR